MCIFSRPVDLVGSTRILVSSMKDGRHATIYQMAYEARADVAMILPVPVRPGIGDDALSFVDLSIYRDFFDELDRCCYPVTERPPGGGGGYGGERSPAPRPKLVVHEVGDFIASYVPSMDEFGRLEECFRLPAAAWETLPDYSSFGFAVFQLQPGAELRETHPLAYHYPPAKPGELYFPTAHLHEGGPANARARFDHALYAQPYKQHPNLESSSWDFSPILPGRKMDLVKSKGLLSGDRRVGRLLLEGNFPNADLVMGIAESDGPAWRSPPIHGRLARVPWDMGDTIGWPLFQVFGGSITGRYPRY
jgi:hypothetical protein